MESHKKQSGNQTATVHTYTTCHISQSWSSSMKMEMEFEYKSRAPSQPRSSSVLSVRTLPTTRFGLPAEITDLILDFAAYWILTTTTLPRLPPIKPIWGTGNLDKTPPLGTTNSESIGASRGDYQPRILMRRDRPWQGNKDFDAYQSSPVEGEGEGYGMALKA